MLFRSDIIFDERIHKNIITHKNKNLLLLKKNWLDIWRGRMNMKKILLDAEDIRIKKNILITIGKKIKDKMPKYQYMGIIKLKFKDFLKLKNFYKKIKINKIDLTSFIDKAIKHKIIRINTSITSKFSYKNDNVDD